MTTFKQFLESQQDFRSFVMENCGSFLKESGVLYGGNLAVRGLRDTPQYSQFSDDIKYAIINVRQDRRPLDFSMEAHYKLDQQFQDEFGWRVRSTGLFVYPEDQVTDANHYGKVHIVFPIGDIKYVWSDNVFDLFGHLIAEPGAGANGLPKEDMDTYKNTELPRALQGPGEIIIQCDKYLAIPISYEHAVKHVLNGEL